MNPRLGLLALVALAIIGAAFAYRPGLGIALLGLGALVGTIIWRQSQAMLALYRAREGETVEDFLTYLAAMPAPETPPLSKAHHEMPGVPPRGAHAGAHAASDEQSPDISQPSWPPDPTLARHVHDAVQALCSAPKHPLPLRPEDDMCQDLLLDLEDIHSTLIPPLCAQANRSGPIDLMDYRVVSLIQAIEAAPQQATP